MCLNHPNTIPAWSMEKLSSMKPVPGFRKVGDRCYHMKSVKGLRGVPKAQGSGTPQATPGMRVGVQTKTTPPLLVSLQAARPRGWPSPLNSPGVGTGSRTQAVGPRASGVPPHHLAPALLHPCPWRHEERKRLPGPQPSASEGRGLGGHFGGPAGRAGSWEGLTQTRAQRCPPTRSRG